MQTAGGDAERAVVPGDGRGSLMPRLVPRHIVRHAVCCGLCGMTGREVAIAMRERQLLGEEQCQHK